MSPKDIENIVALAHGAPVNGHDEAGAPRFPIHIWNALSSLPKRRSLVKGLLDCSAMSVFYGPSNSGKTFAALDLAIAIARGEAWCGRKVERGPAVYVAAEGGLGIRERLDAFAQHHGIDPGETPLFIVPACLDMCSSGADTMALATDIKAAIGETVAIVVIDTLSRVMGGGNENGPDDMGAFVANCDRLRQALGCHIAIVHHTGKDEGRGARGHSLLRAACDTEIEITKAEGTNIVTATVTKQRDHQSGDSFAWTIEPVDLGRDDDGEPVTSCTLMPAEVARPCLSRRPTPTGAAKVALDLLRRAIDEAGEKPPTSNHTPASVCAVNIALWRRYCYAGAIAEADTTDAKSKAFRRASEKLQAIGAIGSWDGWVWLVP